MSWPRIAGFLGLACLAGITWLPLCEASPFAVGSLAQQLAAERPNFCRARRETNPDPEPSFCRARRSADPVPAPNADPSDSFGFKFPYFRWPFIQLPWFWHHEEFKRDFDDDDDDGRGSCRAPPRREQHGGSCQAPLPTFDNGWGTNYGFAQAGEFPGQGIRVNDVVPGGFGGTGNAFPGDLGGGSCSAGGLGNALSGGVGSLPQHVVGSLPPTIQAGGVPDHVAAAAPGGAAVASPGAAAGATPGAAAAAAPGAAAAAGEQGAGAAAAAGAGGAAGAADAGGAGAGAATGAGTGAGGAAGGAAGAGAAAAAAGVAAGAADAAGAGAGAAAAGAGGGLGAAGPAFAVGPGGFGAQGPDLASALADSNGGAVLNRRARSVGDVCGGCGAKKSACGCGGGGSGGGLGGGGLGGGLGGLGGGLGGLGGLGGGLGGLGGGGLGCLPAADALAGAAAIASDPTAFVAQTGNMAKAVVPGSQGLEAGLKNPGAIKGGGLRVGEEDMALGLDTDRGKLPCVSLPKSDAVLKHVSDGSLTNTLQRGSLTLPVGTRMEMDDC